MSGSSTAALDPLANSTTMEPTAGSASAIAMTPSPADVAKLQAQQAYLAYLLDRFHTLQLFLLAGYGIMFLLCLMLITYLRLNRHSAFRGDASAARKVILPAFEPLLWVLATATGVYVIFFCVALATELYTYEISKLATEVFYSGRQFVFLSVVVFMLQKSVSGPALRRSILITFILSTYTLPVAWYMMTYRPKTEFYGVITAVRAPMLLLYTYILIRPPGRASKRSLREFCLFAYVYYALLFTYNDLFNQTKLDSGFVLTYANLLCGALCPLVIWRVLKADTQHWRGLGQRAVALQRLFRQHNHLPERVSSRGLHVLIEMHRKYIIDFAYLEIKQRIGVGASAVVFNGLLRSETPVAIKMYTPSEFTEETVAGFSQEAALCGALHHPNVVRFYGMCVCPPTICLVSELCQGSLEDVLCATARHTHSGNRQQLLLNVAYMLDATRAVAYLHSFRPAFLHRDIKPGNFLVDVENTVKLTDFGESRSLPRSQVVGGGVRGTKPLGRMTSVAELKGDDGERISMDVPMMGAVNLQPVRSSLTGNLVDNAPKMTVKGTVDYMAPEVINGRAGLATYGEAADVYSLGITMWDILNPGQDKYPAANGNHLKIFDLVSNGQRPLLDDRLHPTLRGVIESAWHGDPRLRPSAQNVVNILETVQEELLAAFASELMDELDDVEGIGQKGIEHSLTGEQAVAHMVRLEYVDSVGEALRLGNALMDAGLLHHVKHARPFEPTNAVYFMDDDNVTLCQPFSVKPLDMSDNLSATLETTPEDESTESHVSQPRSHRTESTHANHLERVAATSSGSHSTPLMLENGICMCRKLGQRLAVPKVAARRRFRGKKRQAAANANSVQQQLQARLLHDNYDPLATARGSSEFEEFDLLAASAEGDSVV